MVKAEQPREAATLGRPRSEASRQSVPHATLEILSTTTVRALTIEAIAEKAGVGKTTIYRWWPSKTAVAMETLIDFMLPSTPVQHTKSAGDDISKHVAVLIKNYSGRLGRIVAELLAEGQSEPETLAEFRKRFFAGRARRTIRLDKQGDAAGRARTVRLGARTPNGRFSTGRLIRDQAMDQRHRASSAGRRPQPATMAACSSRPSANHALRHEQRSCWTPECSPEVHWSEASARR
jgi:AcrR family transcriptional regulator